MYVLSGAITASPSRTASAPPGRKAFWMSTTSSASPGPSAMPPPVPRDVWMRHCPKSCRAASLVQMRAMLLDAPGRTLREADVALPALAPEEVLLRVRACGVCRTDLHVLDGELPDPKLPLVLGHEIVATVERVGTAV